MVSIIKANYKILLVLLVPFFTGCNLLQEIQEKVNAIQECSIELENVNHKISFTENTNNLLNYVINVNLIGKNPTETDVSLGRYKFDLYANNKYITSFTTDKPIRLPSNSNTKIPVKIVVSPGSTAGLLLKKFLGKPIEYKVKGTFYISLGLNTISIERQLFHIEQ